MRKLITAVMALAVGGLAGAQTWPTENGQYKLGACYGTKDGVRCDLTYTLLKKQTLDAFIDHREFSVFLTDGTKVSPSISVGGSNWTDYKSVKVYNGTPIKVSLLFNVPANTSLFASLAIGDENIRNIPVRPLGAPAVATPAPAAPAQAVNINISGNWNASLTNCRQSAPGVVVCTATLRK